MKQQEVISVLVELKESGQTPIITYPELEPYFEKGMYIENVIQTTIDSHKFVVTFVMRYYNMAHHQKE